MSDKTDEERQKIDPVFKQLIEEKFGAYPVTCQTEYEVNRLPRTIDAYVTVEEDDTVQIIRQETPFFYLLKQNQIEFKGIGDRLTKKGYHAIRGRMEFLSSNQNVSPSETTVTIICAGKPHAVFNYAKEVLKRPFVEGEQPGYYKIEAVPPIYLIVVNELPLIAKNYPLLVFASKEKKFREFLNEVIVTGEHTYIRYAYSVRPQVTKEILAMAGVQSRLRRADLEFIIEDIGPELFPLVDPKDFFRGVGEEKQKQLLEMYTPKERLANLSIEERLANLSIEERFAGIGIDDLIKGMSPEQRAMLIGTVAKLAETGLTVLEEKDGSSNM